MNKPKRTPVKKTLQCKGCRRSDTVKLYLSVRGSYIAIYAEENSNPFTSAWPHLTKTQAISTIKWLHKAVRELDRREEDKTR